MIYEYFTIIIYAFLCVHIYYRWYYFISSHLTIPVHGAGAQGLPSSWWSLSCNAEVFRGPSSQVQPRSDQSLLVFPGCSSDFIIIIIIIIIIVIVEFRDCSKLLWLFSSCRRVYLVYLPLFFKFFRIHQAIRIGIHISATDDTLRWKDPHVPLNGWLGYTFPKWWGKIWVQYKPSKLKGCSWGTKTFKLIFQVFGWHTNPKSPTQQPRQNGVWFKQPSIFGSWSRRMVVQSKALGLDDLRGWDGGSSHFLNG